jgi:hypothetical protein
MYDPKIEWATEDEVNRARTEKSKQIQEAQELVDFLIQKGEISIQKLADIADKNQCTVSTNLVVRKVAAMPGSKDLYEWAVTIPGDTGGKEERFQDEAEAKKAHGFYDPGSHQWYIDSHGRLGDIHCSIPDADIYSVIG